MGAPARGGRSGSVPHGGDRCDRPRGAPSWEVRMGKSYTRSLPQLRAAVEAGGFSPLLVIAFLLLGVVE
ncbi:unnamed protein product [marine sediment metagenome]|uniref:Uncharacterized protein n=1 Tax=marine sediment metagenome TaxID=412755 RepID=X0W957_9ZZZZ